MRILVIVFLFFLCVCNSFSQTGILCLSVGDDMYYDFELFRDTVLIETTEIDFYEVCFDSLTEGEYNVKIYRDGVFSMHKFGLEVLSDKKREYSLSFLEPFDSEINDTVINDLTISAISVLSNYNNPTYSKLINREFFVSFLGGTSHLLTNNIEIGLKGGTSFSYVDFKNDTSYTELNNVKNERYFNWSLLVEPSIRFSSNNRRDYNTKGAFLELGACYYFPLLFRHVYIANDKKKYRFKITSV